MNKKNINQIVSNYLKFWPLFLCGVFISCLCVFLYIRYLAETEYAIESKILIKNTASGQAINETENFNNYGLIKTANSLDDEIGILTSTGVMEEVISKNNFNISYYIEGNIRDVEIYGEDVPVNIKVDETSDSLQYNLPITLSIIDSVSFELRTKFLEKEHASEHKFGQLVSLPFGIFTVAKKEEFLNIENTPPFYFIINSKEDYVDILLQKLSVIPANKTGSLLTLSFVSNHQNKGEDLLLKLIQTYVRKTIKYENELAETTVEMIDNRLKVLSGAIDSVESSVVNFKTQNAITNVASNAENYIQQSNQYKRQVLEFQNNIGVLENIEKSIVNGSNKNSIASGLAVADPSLTNQIERYNETLLERQRFSQSAVDANPIVIDLDAKLANLRSSILQSVRSTKNQFVLTRRNLLSSANRYDAQIAKVPKMEKKLLDITRDKGTKEGLYLFLLQKREEEVLSMAAPVSSTRIVSYPKSSKFPVSPNKTSLYLGGILLGLFIPFAGIYVKEIFNNKVNTLEDISSMTTAPFLGEIAKSDRGVIVANEGRLTPDAELFRLLIYNLDYLNKEGKNQTMLVTSTIKGEGKSFVASNLAISMANNGEKVVVLAFDLREPQLMNNFNLPNKPGITDFILNKDFMLGRIIQKHPTIENLTLIGSGVVSMHLGRLMLSKQIKVLLDKLKKDFDRIIIDTAPIGLVSDAFALNSYIDSTIYVTRNNVTKKEHLITLDNIYKNNKLKNTMVLLNDTKMPQSYGYNNEKKQS